MSEMILTNTTRPNDTVFYGTAAAAFAAGAAVTIALCRSMPGSMPMPGAWTMSMAWMRMPGRSWLFSFFGFEAMWIAMMIAMMMPALLLTLRSYRTGLRITGRTQRLGGITTMVAAGYFAVWATLGILLYPAGVALASAAMRSTATSRAMPLAAGITLLLAGSLQLTRWKARQLRRCRYSPDCCENPSADLRGALMNGVRSGVRCSLCCASFTAVLLACGVMDLPIMAAVAAGITVERLGPRPIALARTIGAAFIAIGVLTLARRIA